MRSIMRWLVAATVVVLAACHAPTRPPPASPRAPAEQPQPQPTSSDITWTRVETAKDIPAAPAPGTYQIHLIDVGTGLAILVRGAEFSLLYDSGTNDKEEKPLRVAAYLAATLGPSGDEMCVDGGPKPTRRIAIDHVVLSQPASRSRLRAGSGSACYDVRQFWD